MEWISCLSEALILVWVAHNLLHKRLRLNHRLILFLLSDVLIFSLVNDNIISSNIQLIVYIFLIIYFLFEFKEFPLRKIIESVLLSVFLTAGIEIVSYIMSSKIPEDIRGFFVCALMLCMTWIVIKLLNFEKVLQFVTDHSWVLRNICVFCGVLFIVLIFLYKTSEGLSLLDCLLIGAILLIVLAFFQQWKLQKEVNAYQEKELRVLKQSKDSFQHLINDVQARQHEFHNQIEALYSMHYVYDTYEELVESQKNYVSNITDRSYFNKLLTSNCSPIIKGFLYYKFTEFQNQGISVDYRVDMGEVRAIEIEFDVLECIGILLDNAREALSDKSRSLKIDFMMSYIDEKVSIRVENPAAYMTQSEIKLMTDARYTTKGDNRGYGLHNVKKIVKKRRGILLIENKEKVGQNYICIYLELSDI